MSVRASIDLGTNTCLLLVVRWDIENGEITEVLDDRVEIVRLGEGVDRTRCFGQEPMARALACLKSYAMRISELGGARAETVAVATSQARDAKNSSAFFKQVKRETGIGFKVLTGDAEAELTFLGALRPSDLRAHTVVIDIGGGSTELTTLASGVSLDIGSVRLTERWLKSDPVTDHEFWACQAEIDRELETLRSWRAGLTGGIRLLGVAGTVTTLAHWHLGLSHFDRASIDRVELTRGDIHRMVEDLKWRTNAERLSLPGVTRGRADVLLAGALILWRVMEVLDFSFCGVSTRGLRYGVL